LQTSALVNTSIPDVVLRLLPACIDGSLTICAGAGLSKADDAALPLGEELAERLSERLDGRLSGYEVPENPKDLIAVADKAVAASEGLSVLQNEVLELAGFLTAVPNLGHRAVALLLSEGAVRATILWNWDNCVERSVPGSDRLEVALTADDVASLRVPSVIKVHGCATRPSTLLITSDQLAENAPLWAEQAFAQALMSGVIVFIGIGDVADYAQHRLKSLFEQFNSLDIVVVGPSVISNWADKIWSQVTPNLNNDNERRVESTADTFLDNLLRAWASHLLMELKRIGEGNRNALPGIDLITEAVGRSTSVGLVQWCRTAVFPAVVGKSAVRASETLMALLAVAVLAEASGATTLRLSTHAQVASHSSRWSMIVVQSPKFATALLAEVARRAQALAEAGLASDSVVAVVSGPVLGGLPEDYSAGVTDIFAGEAFFDDLVAGPTMVAIKIVHADSVVRSIEP
jgi:hypothetical protein